MIDNKLLDTVDANANVVPKTRSKKPIFSFREVNAPAGSAVIRCNTRAKLPAAKVQMQGVMVRLPLNLRNRLEDETTGPMSVTICALVEYALARLEREQKGIVVDSLE